MVLILIFAEVLGLYGYVNHLLQTLSSAITDCRAAGSLLR